MLTSNKEFISNKEIMQWLKEGVVFENRKIVINFMVNNLSTSCCWSSMIDVSFFKQSIAITAMMSIFKSLKIKLKE